MDSFIQGSIKTPQIYVYTTDSYVKRPWKGSRDGAGLLKIGFTNRIEVTRRIDEQWPIKLPDPSRYELLWKTIAIDNRGKVFSDKFLHAYLEQEKGYTKVNDSEWFECTLNEVKTAVFEIINSKQYSRPRQFDFKPRPEQQAAINLTKEYFIANPGSINRPSHFLWNAKMRFGKTFTSYKLSQEMGWKKILVLTYKPATANQWNEDLNSHIDFEGWTFAKASNKDRFDYLSENHLVYFASFQDILGKHKNKQGPKDKFKDILSIDWDAAFIDEYHFGAWREAARELYASGEKIEFSRDLEKLAPEAIPLKVAHVIYLSGTPFRALANGEFTEDQIFNWTYADEQREKDAFGVVPGNPYLDLPKMSILTYQVPDHIRNIALEGENNEFDLNEFFRAERIDDSLGPDPKNARFIHEDHVNQWLGLLRGQLPTDSSKAADSISRSSIWPFASASSQYFLTHTFWFLPSVDSCYAMAGLLRNAGGFYSNYEIVVAAGTKAGIGEKALKPVKQAIGSDPLATKTITLSCGKLTTGVSIPPWTGIFLLRNTSSPETYFQAAFRVQSPWSYSDLATGQQHVLKENCYVFDFAPSRALRLIAEYSSKLTSSSSEGVEKKVEEFLQFLPVLCFDGSEMQSLNPTELLDIATAGMASTMLARRWQSNFMINLDFHTIERLLLRDDLIQELKNIEGFRNISNLKSNLTKVINHEDAVKKIKRSRGVLPDPLSKEQKEVRKFREELKRDLKKFLTRIPIFMYLTDHREERLIDVIRSIEPELFTRVTGITIKTFNDLVDLGLFNSSVMNAAVYGFKRFEEASLSYAGGGKKLNKIGGFDEQSTEYN